MKSRKHVRPADFGAPESEPAVGFRWSADVSDRLGHDVLDPEMDVGAPLQPNAPQAAVLMSSDQSPALRGSTEVDAETWRSESIEAPPAWPIYLIAFAVSLLWALGPIAFAVGYRNSVAPLQNDQFALAVFALLAIGPAALVWGAAYLIRQGQKLAAESRRAKAQADEMMSPALVAAARAGDVTAAVRDEIARAGAAAVTARESLLALREALAFETERLVEAAAAWETASRE